MDHATASSSATTVAALAPGAPLRPYAGVESPRVFTSFEEELTALTTSVAVFDQGWRTVLRITGEDRVRWLNGMVTNTVKDLAPGRWNYTFLLNAQGRILGDADLFALPEYLLFVTDADQVARLRDHLDHFIIMDEVEMAEDSTTTALGVAGPHASALLAQLGLLGTDIPQGHFLEGDSIEIARMAPDRYTLRGTPAAIEPLWRRLTQAGATPAGVDALEALRVLEGRPRFGIDITERTLAQETGQMHALNFTKGCYLGQEIVERIRSRATVHRGIRAFTLQGEPPAPGTQLFAAADAHTPAGELTSVASVLLPSLAGLYALGTVRGQATAGPLAYSGGSAHVLERPPLPTV